MGTHLVLHLEPQPIVTELVDDEILEARTRDFKRHATKGTRDKRDASLAALIATEENEVLMVLVEELGNLATATLNIESRLESMTTDLVQKQRLVDDLERRSRGDKSLKRAVLDQKSEVEDLGRVLAKRKGERDESMDWYGTLRDATITYRTTIGPSVGKKVEKALMKTAKSKGSFNGRHGAIRSLGHLGGPGTAVSLQKILVGVVKTRTALQRSLPKLMGDVRDMEKRMQEETEKSGGRTSLGGQYAQIIQEANKVQDNIGTLSQLCEALLLAGGESLSREDDKSREKSVTALFRAEKKGRSGARQYSLRLLGSSGLPEVRESMHSALLVEEDPLVRVNLIESLLLRIPPEGEAKLETYLLDIALVESTWLVKACAARSLSELRSRKAIPRLIELLPTESGRTLDEIGRALGSLTGLNFHGNPILWDRWWKENDADYLVPTNGQVLTMQNEREKKILDGTGFFGIQSDSKNVLFVLDLSGSMVWSMVPHPGQDDNGANMPHKGERSRLEEAKSALISAVGGMGRDGTFNMIFYASDVWSWKPTMQPMTDKNVKEALESISGLKAVGGTNIYGALREAMDMAETDTVDAWAEPKVDTIFFLSDGQASMGITTNADEILGFVRERNASGHIAIHTVGLSGAQDAYLLGGLARQNDGVYVAR
jgi:hypothetical protein